MLIVVAAMSEVTHHSHPEVRIQLMQPDWLADIHALLRKAYGNLAQTKGVSYWAAYQDFEITKKRCAKGDTLVAFVGERMVGTVTLYRKEHHDGVEYYMRPGVVQFGMFGVDPDCQCGGVGAKLMDAMEQRAKEQGHTHLALDTAEHATWSLSYYGRRGYVNTGQFVQWERDSFRSVIMSKELK